MNDNNVDVGVFIHKANFVGTCPRPECNQPMTGSYDSDEDDGVVKMKCVNCGFKAHLGLPDDDNNILLPVVGDYG